MLDDALIRKLGEITGPENVLTDDERRAAYSSDATLYKREPDVVVKPRSTEEAARVIALAYENAIPVTPRGAGTGLAGGAIPTAGGMVLSAERMKAEPVVHREDLYAEVAPGIITGDFQRIVESRGLFYPPNPASGAVCTLGGNIAECAGGLRGLKYGSTRRYVLGLELVTPEGKVLTVGARTVKSVAGYDICRLMVGSEGTLGFITSAKLRLLPLPQARRTLSAVFEDLHTATAAAGHLMSEGLLPSSLEVMDEVCTRAVSAHLDESHGEGAILLAEFDGMRSAVSANSDLAAELLKKEFRVDAAATSDPSGSGKIWRGRFAALPALMKLRPTAIVEDITVPVSKLPVMAGEIGKIAARNNVKIAVFGHAGRGNLHPVFLTDVKDTEEMARAKTAVSAVRQVCIDLEGAVSEERGVGLDREPFTKLEIGQSGYEVVRSLKDALDPRGIMNPGKMFYED
ncbi:MAG: FAD-linked oxidase C-terminal domain-containing protein [bacterium]|jgi:glycolate oxidase